MLYCLPHSITITATLAARWLSNERAAEAAAKGAGALVSGSVSSGASFGALETLQFFEQDSAAIIVFALSTGVILGTPPGEIKGMVRRGLAWVLGPYA